MAGTADIAPLTLFERMLLIRMVEEEIARRYGKPGEPQEMRCPVHLSIGQEAVAVGVCAALEQSDILFSTHRNHAHYLAKGGRLKPMLAEIYGKASGCVGGRGGSMHLMDPEVGMLGSVPIVASSIPLAVGAALSLVLDGSDRIASVFFGDAALEEGVWHESANFAMLRGLPVLFVCENNYYSVYTPLRQRQLDAELGRLATAHGMSVMRAHGSDVESVLETARKAVDHIRTQKKPVFLLFETYRYREHCGPNFDDNLGYRPPEEVRHWQEKDPIPLYRGQLIDQGLLDDDLEAEVTARLKKEIEDAFEYARSEALPKPEDAERHVFA